MLEMDLIQNFIFSDYAVRGSIVRLGESYQTIIAQHHYPPLLGRLLGEGLLGITLMSGFLKQSGQLTLEFQGEGDLKLLSARCTARNEIRGLIRANPSLVSKQNLLAALQQGFLTLTYEPEKTVHPYQSRIEAREVSIAAQLKAYFSQSEQLPTDFVLVSNNESASGIMLQVLPAQTEQDCDEFSSLAMLAQTLANEELQGCDFNTLLRRLFHEYRLEVFPPKSVSFGCNCSVPRMQRAIFSMGEQEAQKILTEESYIEVTCEFCGQARLFDEADLEQIFTKGVDEGLH